MIPLILIAIAPVIMILLYVYYRDKHEKEPIGKLILSVVMGAVAVIPILIIEILMSIPSSWMQGYLQAGWDAFVVAAFTEEMFKFLVIMIFIWRSKHFNEPFDGIVYSVYVSLGFALVENILYVVGGGTSTALVRALTAVPAHATFAVVMGFYIGRAKYSKRHRGGLLFAALASAIVLHGIYDFILMSGVPWFLLVFIPFLIGMYIFGLKKLKQLSVISGEQLAQEKLEKDLLEAQQHEVTTYTGQEGSADPSDSNQTPDPPHRGFDA